MAKGEYPLPVKFMCSFVLVIARHKSSAFQIPAVDDDVRPPAFMNSPYSFLNFSTQLQPKWELNHSIIISGFSEK
jgi:hypothetical protein